MSSSEHCRRAIFQIYTVQNVKITRITTFRICNVVYQAGSRWDPKCVFNFLRLFERTFYKSNYIIFILSWCGTHTNIRSKLVDIVTAGSQKIALWGPQRTPLGILRVKHVCNRQHVFLVFLCLPASTESFLVSQFATVSFACSPPNLYLWELIPLLNYKLINFQIMLFNKKINYNFPALVARYYCQPSSVLFKHFHFHTGPTRRTSGRNLGTF